MKQKAIYKDPSNKVNVNKDGSPTLIELDPEQKMTNSLFMDSFLWNKMREHQKIGVSFLVKCITGINDRQHRGCILADSMGLGKSLQMIASLWVVLNQNPFGSNRASVRKAAIICPLSLVEHWEKEVYKWIGRE